MITKLNHAVLWVGDLNKSVDFYTNVLGFIVVNTLGSNAVFLRASQSSNDHDLGLFTAPSSSDTRNTTPHSVGLYHLAWEVENIIDLVDLQEKLALANALTGSADHGVSKSLYTIDPDGIEFEIMWAVPRKYWPSNVYTKTLDLDSELTRFAS